MAVGAGFGDYALSSIFISELRSVELGTVALLCNVLRELFTLSLIHIWYCFVPLRMLLYQLNSQFQSFGSVF